MRAASPDRQFLHGVPHRTRSRKKNFCQPSFYDTEQETIFGIIIPHPILNLYHFCIYVNDFLSYFLQYILNSYIFILFFNAEYEI